MSQLNEKELNYGTCIQCKQVLLKNYPFSLCDTCFAKRRKDRQCVECKQVILENDPSSLCDTCFAKRNKDRQCVKCKQICTWMNWCQSCNSKRFQQNFDNWTSGNDEIDKFI